MQKEEVQQQQQVPALKTVVCSNPGKSDELRILVNPMADGPVTLSLLNQEGIELYHKSLSGTAGQVIPFSFAGSDLAPGFYFAIISTEDQRVVKKICIR